MSEQTQLTCNSEASTKLASKSLHITQMADLSPDVKIYGNPGRWVLVCKASNEAEGWMKSTKAFEIQNYGCLIQVTTQQRNPDGSYSLAEAITFVPGATYEDLSGLGQEHLKENAK